MRRFWPASMMAPPRSTSRRKSRSRMGAKALYRRASRYASSLLIRLPPPICGRRHERAGKANMRAPSTQDVAAGELLLSVENVSLAFGGVKAINGVSFDIQRGEIRAIIGPNGAGKTSMLNVINVFYNPQR